MTQPHEATEIDQLKVILEAPESLDLIDPFNHLSPPSREWLDEKLKRMRTYFKEALDQKDLSLESKVEEYEKRIRDLQSRLQAGKILSETVEWSLGTLQAIKDARPEIAPTSVAEAIKKCEEAIQSAREKGLV